MDEVHVRSLGDGEFVAYKRANRPVASLCGAYLRNNKVQPGHLAEFYQVSQEEANAILASETPSEYEKQFIVATRKRRSTLRLEPGSYFIAVLFASAFPGRCCRRGAAHLSACPDGLDLRCRPRFTFLQFRPDLRQMSVSFMFDLDVATRHSCSSRRFQAWLRVFHWLRRTAWSDLTALKVLAASMIVADGSREFFGHVPGHGSPGQRQHAPAFGFLGALFAEICDSVKHFCTPERADAHTPECADVRTPERSDIQFPVAQDATGHGEFHSPQSEPPAAGMSQPSELAAQLHQAGMRKRKGARPSAADQTHLVDINDEGDEFSAPR